MAIIKQKKGNRDNLAILLYSKSGYGKTYFSATTGLEIPTCFVNIEKKKATLEPFLDKFNGEILHIDTHYDLIKVVNKMTSGETKINYNAFVLDSISRLQLISHIILAQERDNNTNQIALIDRGRSNFSINNFLHSLPTNKMHIIVTSMADFIKNENEVHYTPSLSGQIESSICGWFNIVIFIEKIIKYSNDGNQIIRRFHFQPTANFEAKVEFSDFPNYVDNLTFGEILKLWRGEKLDRPNDLMLNK